MHVHEKEIDEIINSLFNKFNIYSINKDYISNLVFSLINKKRNLDCIIIDTSDYRYDTNPCLYIFFKSQNYLYYKIVRKAIEDMDVLLLLINDKKSIVELILKKLNVDPSKAEDYIIDSLEHYDGKILYSIFFVRYVKSRIKGISNKNLEIPMIEIEEQEVTQFADVVKENSIDTKISRRKSCDDINDNLYEQCMKKCNHVKGTFCKDDFIDLVINSAIFVDIQLYEEKFRIYYMMRFGYMNETFYSREEISSITGISIVNILEYEMKVIEKLKSYVNNLFDGYENYILKKTIIVDE